MKFGSGEIIRVDNKYLFKLSSFNGNPIVKPEDIGLVWEEDGKGKKGAVFNGGVEVFQNKIMLLPRCHKNYRRIKFFDKEKGFERYGMENYVSEIYILSSKDSIHFSIYNKHPIKGDGSEHKDFVYGIEDIRIIKHNDMFFLIGCGKIKPPFKGGNADRIAIYTTYDFQKIKYHGIISAFDARNTALLFTDKGIYVFLRFYPNINVVKLPDIEFILEPDKHIQWWKRQKEQQEESVLLKTGDFPHESEKIGVGTQLIPTEKGWLFIYHAVGHITKEITEAYNLKRDIPRGYSVNAALLDYKNPGKVIARSQFPIYIPNKPYELEGDEKYPIDVPDVVFPTGAILKDETLFVYAGAGDKYVILLTCNIHLLLEYLLIGDGV